MCWLHWPCGLRRRSAAARVLGLWIRNSLGAWTSFSCECCVLSGRYPCVVLIARPEESYRVWCVWVWSWTLDNEKALTHWGLLRHGEKNSIFIRVNITNLLTVIFSPPLFPLYFIFLRPKYSPRHTTSNFIIHFFITYKISHPWKQWYSFIVQGGSNMTGTDFFCNHNCSSL